MNAQASCDLGCFIYSKRGWFCSVFGAGAGADQKVEAKR